MQDIRRENFRANYLNTLQYMQQNASLFIQAIEDDSQNSFREHYFSTMIDDYIRLIDSYIANRPFPEGHKRFFAHFYAAGSVETTLDFLYHPSDEAAALLVEQVCMLQDTGLYSTIDRILAEYDAG